MRPTKVKGEVEKPEICRLPIPFILKQTFQNGDRLPPFPLFDPDQVGNLPEIQFLFLLFFYKIPKRDWLTSFPADLSPNGRSETVEIGSFQTPHL